MNENFYRLYKSFRNWVQYFDHSISLDDHNCEFIVALRAHCENYDRSNRDCLERWLEEGRQSERDVGRSD